jgi:hypothetical protein
MWAIGKAWPIATPDDGHAALPRGGFHGAGELRVQRPCVDDPHLARGNFRFDVVSVGCSHVSGLFDAARMAAGPDAIRECGPNQSHALKARPL